MGTFNNKVIWITGASSGIGEVLARQFASQNARVVISARNTEKLEKIKSSLASQENILVLPLDLEKTSNINLLTEKVIDRFGRIDVLINNGGISQRSLTKDTVLEIDRRIMETNFFGTVAITKSVLPYMLKQKSGHIVAMSSIAGKFGFFYRSAYSASKHALHGFFESMRMEVYKENINVLIVCPGKIKTNISVNAVTGDGAKHGLMDESTERGISAEECAKQILKAIENNKEEVFIGGKELRAVWMKRLFPSLFSKIIRKQKPE